MNITELPDDILVYIFSIWGVVNFIAPTCKYFSYLCKYEHIRKSIHQSWGSCLYHAAKREDKILIRYFMSKCKSIGDVRNFIEARVACGKNGNISQLRFFDNRIRRKNGFSPKYILSASSSASSSDDEDTSYVLNPAFKVTNTRTLAGSWIKCMIKALKYRRDHIIDYSISRAPVDVSSSNELLVASCKYNNNTLIGLTLPKSSLFIPRIYKRVIKWLIYHENNMGIHTLINSLSYQNQYRATILSQSINSPIVYYSILYGKEYLLKSIFDLDKDKYIEESIKAYIIINDIKRLREKVINGERPHLRKFFVNKCIIKALQRGSLDTVRYVLSYQYINFALFRGDMNKCISLCVNLGYKDILKLLLAEQIYISSELVLIEVQYECGEYCLDEFITIWAQASPNTLFKRKIGIDIFSYFMKVCKYDLAKKCIDLFQLNFSVAIK